MPTDMPFQPFEHAAAHERLADLGLEADGLEHLRASALPEDRALLAHLDGCSTCQAQVAEATQLRDALRSAFQAMPDLPSLDPIVPPSSLRAAVLQAARSEPRASRAEAVTRAAPAIRPLAVGSLVGRRRLAIGPLALGLPALALPALPRPAAPRWAALVAAALVIAVVGGGVGLQLGRHSGDNEIASMVQLVGTVDRVLAADPHWVATLRTPTGTQAGSVSWSKQDFAVLTTALSEPAAGQVYRCWIEWNGHSAVIGQMDFAGGTAYWVGSVGDWATLNVSGAKFVVTLGKRDVPPPASGPATAPVLEADLTE